MISFYIQIINISNGQVIISLIHILLFSLILCAYLISKKITFKYLVGIFSALAILGETLGLFNLISNVILDTIDENLSPYVIVSHSVHLFIGLILFLYLDEAIK